MIKIFKQYYGERGEKRGRYLVYHGLNGSDSKKLLVRDQDVLQEYKELREDRYYLRLCGISRRGLERDHKLRRAL